MASTESKSAAEGKLVALEADRDTVSTQLHLLPPSQKILILPSILENLPTPQANEAFNARSFVKEIHTLFTERTQKARSFLELSTGTEPRLVFTHGGSVSARATCIARIAENVADGNLEEAEAIFNDIVKDGVAGLTKTEKTTEMVVEEEAVDHNSSVPQNDRGEQQDLDEDPTVKAMKAAESLDREAANLESDEPVDNSAEALHGGITIVEAEETSSDSPKDHTTGEPTAHDNTNEELLKVRYSKKSKIPVREVIFTAPKGEEIRRTVLVLPKRSSLLARRSTIGSQIPQLASSKTLYGDIVQDVRSDDEVDDEFDISSPGYDTFPSTPVVVYGEACLVNMQPIEPEKQVPVRKIKSMDRFFPSLYENSEISLSPQSLKHGTSNYQLETRPKTSDGPNRQIGNFQTLPRTTFVRASQTTIRRSPTISDAASSCASSLKEPSRIFVDRGTDAGEVFPPILAEEASELPVIETGPFEPVFPLVEDLIINFTSRGSDKLFESVLASYKNGSYPLLSANPPTEDEKSDPIASEEDRQELVRPISNMTTETDDAGYARRHTYDPYAHHPEAKTQWPLKDGMGRVDSKMQMQPPTPCLTPTPNALAEKFVDFFPGTATNAVSLQNSLRQILSIHFPVSEGYTQYLYPVPADMDRLWKPVFRGDDSGSIGEDGRTVDQIVALGCEAGVKKDFFAQISGHIERLGTKRTGISRSGKLDIRYLISNIMQRSSSSFTSPPTPSLLATLLVAQLEAYLASNNSTRFLIIQYGPEHLATVLALQNLIGGDILKVAGILDTLSSDPSSISRPRTPQLNPLSNEATMVCPSSRRHHSLSLKQQLTNATELPILKKKAESLSLTSAPSSPPSFSKANYLIPSAATDAEITVFLSTIWKPLMEKSSFYIPEPEPKPVIISAPPPPLAPRLPTPKTPTGSHGNSATAFREMRDRERSGQVQEVSYPPSSFKPPKSPNTNSNDKIARLTGQDRSSNKYAPSVTSTVRTTASERGRREDREWENFYIAEEDSEDDEYDKMILGRGYAKIVPEVRKVGAKRNTKKALKWLGLA